MHCALLPKTKKCVLGQGISPTSNVAHLQQVQLIQSLVMTGFELRFEPITYMMRGRADALRFILQYRWFAENTWSIMIIVA